MTMAPMWKTCPMCHKKYDWNPDVGNFTCPYCHGLGKPGKNILGKILGKKKEGFPDEVSVNTENPILGKDGKPQNKRIKIDK